MMLPKELTTVTSVSKILAMAVFIALPIVGFFLGVRYQEMLNLAKSQEMEINLEIPRSPIPINETANWKTYTNTKYGYSLKYPPDWKVNSAANSLETSNFKFGMGPSPEQGAQLQSTVPYQSYKSINDWLPSESVGDQFIANQKTFVINTLPAASYDNNGIGASKIVGILNKKNEKVYQFSFSSSSSSKQINLYIFDQILATFQFTN